jgi:DNA-binding NarL/FixJ family response regulator
VSWARWVSAISGNGLGRYADAAAAARQASQDMPEIDRGLGIEARCRALVSAGQTAEDRYREAIVRGKTPRTAGTLTPQEGQIARLAAEGHSNPQIGAQLFLSDRTVEFHLSKVYAKLGIGSRRELHAALAALSEAGPSA